MSICTTVAAIGEAEADYTHATFSLSLSTVEKTVPLAKAKMKEKVVLLQQSLLSAIEKHKVTILAGSAQTHINISRKYKWVKNLNEQVLEGYEVTYNFSFRTETLDKVSEIYDELTSLTEISVSSPVFGLKDITALNDLALQDAWINVSKRFANECKVLGLVPNDYVIENWTVEYSDSRRINRGMTRRYLDDADASICAVAAVPGGGDEPIEIMAGTAKVTVNLNVGYKLK